MTSVARAAFVRIPRSLRPFTGGVGEVPVSGATVREALGDLTKRFPRLRADLLDEGGELHTAINLFLGRDDLAALGGLDLSLEDGTVLSIVPAVAGEISSPAR